MNIINYRISKIYLAVIVVSAFIAGCVQPINLGLMESGKNSSVQEFYVNNYKMKLRVIPIANDYEYNYSFSLVNKNDDAPVKNVESTLGIKKYPYYPQFHGRHRHDKEYVANGLEPFYDSTKIGYEYKYKFKNKGKYELTIKLTEINGKELDKDIQISFDQEVK